MLSVKDKQKMIEDGIKEFSINPNFSSCLRWFLDEMNDVNKKEIENVLDDFIKSDIPLYDEDDSKQDSDGKFMRSRTYCGIKREHKKQIYKWFRCKLFGEELIKNL